MYSVIETGGLQHKVSLGETLKVPKLEAEVGSEVTLANVLLFTDGKEVRVGTPHLADTCVKAEILSHGKGDKVRIFKKKRRKGYRRTQGHRQHYTEILIKEFINGDKSKAADKKTIARARARLLAINKLKSPTTPLAKKDQPEEKKGE